MQNLTVQPASCWGDFVSYDDVARFEYGRRLWRIPAMRRRLLAHWSDQRHPYRVRFADQRTVIEEVLASDEPPESLDQRLRRQHLSLRAVAREIPPVFGSFF